jgi:hypothetical protein
MRARSEWGLRQCAHGLFQSLDGTAALSGRHGVALCGTAVISPQEALVDTMVAPPRRIGKSPTGGSSDLRHAIAGTQDACDRSSWGANVGSAVSTIAWSMHRTAHKLKVDTPLAANCAPTAIRPSVAALRAPRLTTAAPGRTIAGWRPHTAGGGRTPELHWMAAGSAGELATAAAGRAARRRAFRSGLAWNPRACGG